MAHTRALHKRRELLRSNVRFQRLAQHLHNLGPRPMGQMLVELATPHNVQDDLMCRLEDYYSLDPAFFVALAARDWLPPHLLVVPK